MQFSFWLIFFFSVYPPSLSYFSVLICSFCVVSSFNSFKLNLWLQKHDWHIFDQHLRMRENLLSTAAIPKKPKWSILKLRKRFLASVTHRFFFSVASLLFVWFGLFSYHFVDGWTAIKVPNLYDNHLCFVWFHCFYIVFFFLFSSRLVEGFYQINPLGLATFIFQFVFSRLELLPHCNASRQSIPFETSCLW